MAGWNKNMDDIYGDLTPKEKTSDTGAGAGVTGLLGMLPALQGVMGIGQKIVSAANAKKAKKDFTPYEIPSSVKLALDKANSLASQTQIPGADIYRSQAESAASRSIEAAQRTAGSSSDVMGALPGVQNNLNEFYKNIASKGAEYYQGNQAQQQRALNQFGQYETERWRQNEYLPYMQALQGAQLQGQAGNQNIGSAIGSGMAIGMAKWETAAADKEYQQWLEMKGAGGKSKEEPIADGLRDPNVQSGWTRLPSWYS